jgi:hypothetical protein
MFNVMSHNNVRIKVCISVWSYWFFSPALIPAGGGGGEDGFVKIALLMWKRIVALDTVTARWISKITVSAAAKINSELTTKFCRYW